MKDYPHVFVVSEPGEKIRDIEEVEEDYNARFIDGYTKNGRTIYTMQSLDGASENWVFDVWDNEIVLKKREWGIGKGCKPAVKGIEFVDIGRFSFPTKHELTDEEKRNVQILLENEFDVRICASTILNAFYAVSTKFVTEFKKICF